MSTPVFVWPLLALGAIPLPADGLVAEACGMTRAPVFSVACSNRAREASSQSRQPNEIRFLRSQGPSAGQRASFVKFMTNAGVPMDARLLLQNAWVQCLRVPSETSVTIGPSKWTFASLNSQYCTVTTAPADARSSGPSGRRAVLPGRSQSILAWAKDLGPASHRPSV